MTKTEYTIDGRPFRVEKHGKGWRGWFTDDPATVIAATLKRDVLDRAGYVWPRSSGIEIIFTNEAVQRRVAEPRTMQDAYEDLRRRLKAGHFPRFRRDRPLSKFVILARDGCRCIFCGAVPERSADAQLEHLLPVSVGGRHVAGNVAVACSGCNLRKGNKWLDDLARWLEVVSDRNRERGISDEHELVSFGRPCLETEQPVPRPRPRSSTVGVTADPKPDPDRPLTPEKPEPETPYPAEPEPHPTEPDPGPMPKEPRPNPPMTPPEPEPPGPVASGNSGYQ